VLLTHQLFDALGAHPGAVGAGGGGGGGGGGEAAATTDPNAHSGSGGAETTFNPPEVIDPNFTISNKEGGYQLLGSLGIDPSKWDGIEQQLKTLSPSEFFLMDDGHYGLQNPGAILSEPVRNLINTLK